MNRKGQLLLFLAIYLVGLPTHAGVNKCVDAAGKVTYQQQPCPRSSMAQPLTSAASMGGGWQSWKSEPLGDGKKEYFIHSNVQTVGKLRRAAFKVNVTDPANPDLKGMSGVLYHYYDCSAGTVSAGIPEDLRSQLEPTIADAAIWPYDRAASQGIDVADSRTIARVCGG